MVTRALEQGPGEEGGPGRAGGAPGYRAVPLGKRNLEEGLGHPGLSPVGTTREDPGRGLLGPGEPGQGKPGQKDRGREARERGDSGPGESLRAGSGSSRDRSSTRCHFSWTCCGEARGGLRAEAEGHAPRPHPRLGPALP